jgi:alcohol dehydrogenase class IV
MEAQPLEAEARQFSGFKPFYQFASRTRVVAGLDLLDSVGFEFAKEGATRALIVTDEVIRGTGLIDRIESGVTDGGVEVAGIFDQVPQDSDSEAVAACAELAKGQGADSFLAVGGGSVMDTAKVGDLLFTHGGEVRQWEGVDQVPRENDGAGPPLPAAPLACVPTTAGTGSEVSQLAMVKDREAELKVLVGDSSLSPSVAILDPAATETLPPPIAAATGMDALTHAIEGVTSTEWSPHNDAYGLQAIRMIRDNLETAVTEPSNVDARGNMLVAASIAIVPTANLASGIVHAMSHPCGGRYGVPHGVANAINLPWVIEYNAAGGEEIADRYRAVADTIGVDAAGAGEEVGAAVANHIRALTGRLGLPQRLSEVGVPEEAIEQLAADAVGDGSVLVNPREPTEEDFVELYKRAL